MNIEWNEMNEKEYVNLRFDTSQQLLVFVLFHT